MSENDDNETEETMNVHRPLDPYFLLSPKSKAFRLLHDWQYAYWHNREAADRLRVSQERMDAGRTPNFYDEHEFLKDMFPAVMDALEVLMALPTGIRMAETPSGLKVQAFPNDSEKFRVWNLKTRQALKGGATGERPAPEWITPPPGNPCQAFSASEQKEWKEFFQESTFFGGFWQAWECALKADRQTLSLPLDGAPEGGTGNAR